MGRTGNSIDYWILLALAIGAACLLPLTIAKGATVIGQPKFSAYSTARQAEILARVTQTHFTAYSTSRAATPPGSAAWGTISGTLSAQTDLNNALNNRVANAHFSTYSSNRVAERSLPVALAGVASSVDVTASDTNANFAVPFTSTGGGVSTVLIDTTAPHLRYNPSTSTVTATNFAGNASTVTGLSVTGGKTLNVNNTLTLSGTDSSTLAIGTGGTLGTAAYTASTAYEASGAVTTHSNLTTGVHGAGANSFVYSNDSRLTDARAPTSHNNTAHSETYLTTTGSAANLTSFPTLNQNTSGSAATLTTPRNIGGRSFNGSADIVAPTYKTGITTRDVTTASGTVNVAHGLGRVPTLVRVTASLISSASVTQQCFGVYDGTNHSGMSVIYVEGTTTATTDQHFTSTSFELGFSAATVVNPYTGANRQTATITVDSTNIIFTWTKTGTVATATANILWEVM